MATPPLHRFFGAIDPNDVRGGVGTTAPAAPTPTPVIVFGTLANRPAAGAGNRIWITAGEAASNDNGIAFADDGTTWQPLAANVRDLRARPSATAASALRVTFPASGQSVPVADVVRDDGVTVFSVGPNGQTTARSATQLNTAFVAEMPNGSTGIRNIAEFRTGTTIMARIGATGAITGQSLSVTGTVQAANISAVPTVDSIPLSARAAVAGSTMDLTRWSDSSQTMLARIDSTGGFSGSTVTTTGAATIGGAANVTGQMRAGSAMVDGALTANSLTAYSISSVNAVSGGSLSITGPANVNVPAQIAESAVNVNASGGFAAGATLQTWQVAGAPVARVGADGSLVSTVSVKPGGYASTSRPSASALGAGAMIFDTTLGRPLWSTGSAWVTAGGANPDVAPAATAPSGQSARTSSFLDA